MRKTERCSKTLGRRTERRADRAPSRVYANCTATIADVQSLPSPEVTLLQMCDVLLGAASIRIKMAPFVRRVLTRCLPKLIEVSAQFEEMPEKYWRTRHDSNV